MKKLSLLFSFLILLLNNCSNKSDQKIDIIKEGDLNSQMMQAYTEGMEAFDNQLYLEAAKKFNEAEIFFPQSEWAPKASLMAAYSYFYDDYNNDAINQLESFIKSYPEHPQISYAYYLLALCYYNLIIDEKKDLEPIIQSKIRFEFVIQNFPNTDYAINSSFKLDLINELLASKEMYLANYYIKKEKWAAAINRLKYVLENYATTIFVEEALHRLTEIYYKLGLIEESKKYAILLGHNYPNSEWYRNSYKIFDKNYNLSINKKIDKKSTLQKLRSIIK